MQFRFPLKDVKIEIGTQKKKVENPLYDNGLYRLNQNEFSMEVEEVGSFYAANGNFISIIPNPEVSDATIELYLNGSTYGAILHQRKIMPIHGSCFVFNNRGIMLCGESGAGKSSLTASFCKNGNTFLTDDVTPVIFSAGLPFILPLSDRIKLWDDSLIQLNFTKENLTQIWEAYEKYYLPIEKDSSNPYPLHLIFVLEKQEGPQVKFQEITGIERFTVLRNEIYRWEYLQGMPVSEVQYLNQLINISKNVHVFKVFRPEVIEIERLTKILSDFIINSESKIIIE